jgi:serine protease
MRSLAWILVLALAVAAGAAEVITEINPVRTHPHQPPQTAPLHVIVKLRPSAAAPVQSGEERISALVGRASLTLHEHRPITGLMHIIHVESATSESPTVTLARLRADPEVEYAELDQRRYIHALTPNDPLYTQQWYLQVGASTPSAVDATDAWPTTTGSSSLVIADIDNGVRPDHPDLMSRLLTGYCFISDSFVANGGSCPGVGATDPGDWITQQDVNSSPSGECSGETPGPSSWHGTRVAGILGAVTNNGVGVAGLTWSAQLLPVRALGKCGGLDSDIISAMLWAAGISVSGAPANANPAKIINMSLGGTGSCPPSYQDAINQITAKGVLIVVSAGNEGGPVDAPANCQGVVGVAGLRQAGTKVGYSSLGPEVSLAAPAGNCSDAFTTTESPCVYTLTTTTNLGYQQPDANDYTGEYYCDPTLTGSYANCTLANSNQYRTYNLGTSFSAPIVSGIGALMVSVNSNLNSCQLISRLKEGAQPFPQTSLDAQTQPPACHVPANANDIQNSECICTQGGNTCGVGMANAPASLTAALRPIAAVSLPASVSPGQSITLDGSGSAAANSHSLSTYQWSPVSGGLTLSIQGASSSKATVTAPSCGIATVSLTVTDDGGRSDIADVVITPTSVNASAPSAAGQSVCSLAAPAVQVAACPGTISVPVAATQTFTASLANTTNTAVNWEVGGVAGGNATVGTISSSGLYTAPNTVPSPATVTVTAVSAADSSAQGSAQVTITPITVSVSPTTASVQVNNVQTFTASVGNSTNTAVAWSVNGVAGGNSTVGTISAVGVYSAPTSVPSPATVTVAAVSVVSATAFASAQVTVTPAPKGGGGMLDQLTLLVCGLLAAALAGRRLGRRRWHVP